MKRTCRSLNNSKSLHDCVCMIEFSRLAHLLWAILRYWLSVYHSVYSSKNIILRVMPYSGLLHVATYLKPSKRKYGLHIRFKNWAVAIEKLLTQNWSIDSNWSWLATLNRWWGKCWISSTKTKPELIIFFSFWKKKIGGCKIETGNRILFSPQSTASKCCNKTGLEGKNNTFLEQ